MYGSAQPPVYGLNEASPINTLEMSLTTAQMTPNPHQHRERHIDERPACKAVSCNDMIIITLIATVTRDMPLQTKEGLRAYLLLQHKA
jgi:hypothetical protein